MGVSQDDGYPFRGAPYLGKLPNVRQMKTSPFPPSAGQVRSAHVRSCVNRMGLQAPIGSSLLSFEVILLLLLLLLFSYQCCSYMCYCLYFIGIIRAIAIVMMYFWMKAAHCLRTHHWAEAVELLQQLKPHGQYKSVSSPKKKRSPPPSPHSNLESSQHGILEHMSYSGVK